MSFPASPPLRRAALAAALAALCSGCMWHRTGEPFVATRMGAELAENGLHLGWSDSGTPPGIGHSCGCCFALTGGPAIDLLGLPVDLALQAFAPARIRVVDEEDRPIRGADATVLIECGAPDDTILHRRTGRDGTFRLRRRVSNENPLGGRVVSARIAKDGYRPVRVADFSAFAWTNVVTVTLGPLTNDPGRVRVFEWDRGDPGGRFPPWPTEPQPQQGGLRAVQIAGIDCIHGEVRRWDRKHGDDFDLNLRVDTTWKPNGGIDRREIDLFVSRNADGVALVDAGPEGPDYVPEDTDFTGWPRHLSDSDFVPGKVVFFRFRGRSEGEPPRYGRIEIFWEKGLPAGVRKIVVSDIPGERSLRVAPPPAPATP